MVTPPDSSIRPRFGSIRPAPTRTGGPKTEASREREQLLPPERRGFQVIPTSDVLETLIHRAIEALKAGIFWDRGSILNLLV